MKRMLAMIAAAMAACRTVWERCARTGAWVARTVISPFVPAGAGDYQVAEPVIPAPVQDGLPGIRRLAGAMAGDRVTEADLADVSDAHIEWLAYMDRRMLARVLCADDGALRDHLKGRRTITGVLAADRESVAAWRNMVSVTATDDEPEPQPVYGMAA